MRYELHDGRILTWSLESHVTTHCNLRCVQCCPLSPHLPTWAVAPAALGKDLRNVWHACSSPTSSSSPAESPSSTPTSPPSSTRCAPPAISEQVSITTNGFLAQSAPDAVYERLDRMTLSVYTSAPLPERSISRITERCEQHGVHLTVKRIDAFQQLTPDTPHASDADVRAVSRALLAQGALPPGLPRPLLRLHAPAARGHRCSATEYPDMPALREVDGVSLDAPDLLTRVLAYLERDTPLATCRYCLGASGPSQPHAQAPSPRNGNALAPAASAPGST